MERWVVSRRRGPGEAAAFDVLWERHHKLVFRSVRRVLGAHRALIEEAVQDAWVEVVRATHYSPGSFRSFLRVIATRKALDRLESQLRQPSEDEPALDDEKNALCRSFPGLVQAMTGDPAREVQARESAALIFEIVEHMPETQRTAWVLRYAEQLTFQEVADAMGTPLGTAKTRVRLADEFLAFGLQERGTRIIDFVACA